MNTMNRDLDEALKLTTTCKRKKMSPINTLSRKDGTIPSFSFSKELPNNPSASFAYSVMETSRAHVSLSTRQSTSLVTESTNNTGTWSKTGKDGIFLDLLNQPKQNPKRVLRTQAIDKFVTKNQ